MNLKKIIASVAAAAIAVTSMATVSVSAASDVLDFEDGSYEGVSMKTDDGGDKSTLSIVDFNGSKALKVEVKNNKLVPKVYFNLTTLLGADNLESVAEITFDLSIESKDGTTAPGRFDGAIGLQGGEAKTPEWYQASWAGGEYNNPVSEVMKMDVKVTTPLVNGTENTHMLLMRWAADVSYNMYIDNVKFLDKDGNTIPVITAEPASAATETTPAETEATPASTEAAPAEETKNDSNEATVEETVGETISEDTSAADTTAASTEDSSAAADTTATDTTTPSSDSTTTAAKTGNTAAAVVVSVMAVAAAAAVVSKRK